MKTKRSSWKRVSISLRDLGHNRSAHAPCPSRRDAPRALRLETLCQRHLLAADIEAPIAPSPPDPTDDPEDVPQLVGDVNNDGDLTSLDALAILNSINDPIGFPETHAMDVSQNGVVNLNDYGLVLTAIQMQDAAQDTMQQSSPQSMGGVTQVTSTCDADEVLLDTLQSTREDLQSQLADATHPSQVSWFSDQIAAIDATIAQVEARLNDCEPKEEDGSVGDEGATGGALDDPYNDSTHDSDDGTSGSATDGSHGDPYEGTQGTETPGGTDVDGTTSGVSAGSTTGSTMGSTSGSASTTSSGTTYTTTWDESDGTSMGSTAATQSTGTSDSSNGSTSGSATSGTITTSETPNSGVDGSTTGSSSGSSDTSEVDFAEPLTFSIAALRAGMFNDALDGTQPPQSVREAKQLRIAGWVSGPWSKRDAPDLTVFADINFDGDFDDEDEMVQFKSGEFYARSRDYGLYDQYSGFDAYFTIPDDGESEFQGGSPGNDTWRDDIDYRIEFTSELIEDTAKISNVSPLFTSRPHVTTETDAEGDEFLVVTSSLWDPGVWDRHHVTVKWPDGVTTEANDEATTLHPTTLEYQPTETKTIRVTRPMPEDGLSLHPITVTLHDDDQGQTSYLIQSANVTRNNDDDDENDTEDMHEGASVQEDDIVKLSLQAFTGRFAEAAQPVAPDDDGPDGGPETGSDPPGDAEEEPQEPDGYFFLGYDTRQIKLWDSPEKNHQYTPGIQKDVLHPYRGESDVWIEGIGIGATRISLSWKPNFGDAQPPNGEPERTVFLGHVDVTIWGIDVDIDSDNNNGFGYPDNSEWEEYLESSRYGIGKLLYEDAPNFTPVRVRLPQGLNVNDPNIQVTLIGSLEDSGVTRFWNTYKADPNREASDVRDGGNKLSNVFGTYSLSDLNYSPATGSFTIYLEAMWTKESHDTKWEIDNAGRPVNTLEINVSGIENLELSDMVQYVNVLPGSLLPRLLESPAMRNAIASDLVYGARDSSGISDENADPIDSSDFGLQLVSIEELSEHLAASEIVQRDQAFILDQFQYRAFSINDTDTRSVPGMAIGLYRDHTQEKAYRLAFRGTNPTQMIDIIANAEQLLAEYSRMYSVAAVLSELLTLVPEYHGRLSLTGHSLGGGLASAGAIAAAIQAETFNAAGLVKEALADPIEDIDLVPGARSRFDRGSEYVTSYQVWTSYTRSDGTRDAPDLLSFLQNSVEIKVGDRLYLPDAVGHPVHFIEGIYDLTASESEFLHDVQDLLSDPDSASLIAVLTGLVNVEFDVGPLMQYYPHFEFDYQTALNAGDKLLKSHGFDSIYYGVMHGPGWNVYHVPSGLGNGGVIQ
ncbi:dockerin type I repeat-containing protein [Allorhodopirellula solitaria]|uniref:Lipase (Class 3) n=1 Tax=Allorhodopirellula solitaria TaxID=2527987 RepID=A0A5C5WXP8_9BACT|nr:dockerin type I repeat-containing protein [Allorhodopirellula solitaria]TWT55378.1 hypothetical protein CA85_49510 [Allorhodopirellula solitaria]